MRRRTCFGFFGFLTIDYRATQAYLDTMAEKGWALARVWFGVAARFRRTDRTDLHYHVDIAHPVPEDTPEHRTRCREAGWERLYTVRYMNIYRSLPGARTEPIRPMDGETFRRYRNNVMCWMAVCAVAMAALLAFQVCYLSFSGLSWAESLLRLASVSVTLAFLLLAVPFVLAGGGLYLFCSLRRLLQWRQAEKAGDETSVPPIPRARLRGGLTVLTYLGSFLLIPAAACDLASFPNPLPLMLLGIGGASLFLITLCADKDKLRQPKRVWMGRCLIVACAVLSIALVRWGTAGEFEAERSQAASALPTLEHGRYETLESAASVLLSRAEGVAQAGGEGEVRTAVCSCRGEGMARLTLWALWRPGMVSEGGECFRLEGEEETVWLCREGSEVRLGAAGAAAPPALSDQIANWVMTGRAFSPEPGR